MKPLTHTDSNAINNSRTKDSTEVISSSMRKLEISIEELITKFSDDTIRELISYIEEMNHTPVCSHCGCTIKSSPCFDIFNMKEIGIDEYDIDGNGKSLYVYCPIECEPDERSFYIEVSEIIKHSKLIISMGIIGE